MGLCASQDNRRRKNKGSDRKRAKRRDRRHRYESSSSESPSSDSDSEDSDSRHHRRRKHHKRHDQSKADNADSGSNDGGQTKDHHHHHHNGTVMDPQQYSLQYPPISDEDLDILFYKARTCYHFLPTPIPQELLRNAMKLTLLAPSAYNCCPIRVIFVPVDSPQRQNLLNTIDSGNQRQCNEAPVIAIVCTDSLYTRNLPKLMPYVPNAQQMFEQYDDLNEMIRIRNANLQGGYLILALRSLGLGVGPVSGFDNERVDALFLQNTTWESNFLVNIGYPDPDFQPAPRNYRLPFDVAAKLI